MEMFFSFEDFQSDDVFYPTKHSLFKTWDKALFRELEIKLEVQEDNVKRTFLELERRTTTQYFRKVFTAQTRALNFARKWFPSYKFIMPEALADDWLSTMDWHKVHPTRDHSLHQALTATIVSKMLGNGDPAKGLMLREDESLLSRCAKLMVEGPKMSYLRAYLSDLDSDYQLHKEAYNFDWAVEAFYEAAMIAAQFHDMGYPWQFVNTLTRNLKKAQYDKVTRMLINDEEAYKEIYKRLLVYPLFGYNENDVKEGAEDKVKVAMSLFRDGLLGTHGLPGALGFMCLNDNTRAFGKSDNIEEATNRLILDWAAVAIMMHDMPGLYWGRNNDTGKPSNPVLRLDFETDPLSCLISIGDMLEEFERPLALFSKSSKNEGTVQERVEVDYDFACKRSQVKIENGKLLVNYYYKPQDDPKEWEKIKDRRTKEVWEYLNPTNGYVDLSSWGVIDAEGVALIDEGGYF